MASAPLLLRFLKPKRLRATRKFAGNGVFALNGGGICFSQ